MKKQIALLLAIVMILTMTACGGGEDTANTSPVDTETAETSPTPEPEEIPEPTPTPEPVVYNFGDSITSPSGMFIFAPTFEGFAAAVANHPDENYLQPDGQGIDDSKNPFVADEGKVMMYFSAIVEYIGDSKENESFSFNYIVDYDDGYIFEGSDFGMGYSVNESDWSFSGSATFEPLSSTTSRYIRFCIEVPDALENDFEKQTVVIFTIEEENFTFLVDTEAAANAKAAREAAEEAERIEKLTKVDEVLASEIKGKLQGSWNWSVYGYAGTSMYTTTHDLSFNGDTVSIKTTNSLLGTTLSNTGTYYVANAYIVLSFQDGSEAYMPYTYENGELTISQDFEGEFYTV